MPNPILLLNQPQVSVGLGTLTHTIAVTGQYNVQYQVTVPQALILGSSSGSGRGLGISNAGGGKGFVGGANGLGEGGVGQGFGTGNSYQQPPTTDSNQTSSGSAVSSGLSVLVKKNGSTIFTAPTLAAAQADMQFKYSFPAAATDVITVVISSAVASDSDLNGVKNIVSINQGL